MKSLSLAIAALALSGVPATACQIDLPPGETWPTWDESIANSPDIFVGRVATILPSFRLGWPDRVVIIVEQSIRGDHALLYVTDQGSGGDCRHEFALGHKVIFAGEGFFDPTELFPMPPTKEEERRLAAVRTLAPNRH